MSDVHNFVSEYRSGALSQSAQATWRAIQARLFLYLTTLVVLTFLFVMVFYAVPIARGEHEGTQVVAGARDLNFAILAAHVATAIPPLLIGIVAFSKRARKRSLRAHRWLGTTYCVCIWISAVTGVILASANTMGLASRLGFGTLGILWFFTTLRAYQYARRKDIPRHRIWMIRSFALTLAVVTIRPIMMLPMFVEVDIATLNNVGSWACWVPNILLAELYIRRTTFVGKLRPPSRQTTDAQIVASRIV